MNFGILALETLFILTVKAVVAFAITAALSYLFAKKPSNKNANTIGSYPMQGANTGAPVTIVRGKRKLAGTVVWFGDLHPYKARVA